MPTDIIYTKKMIVKKITLNERKHAWIKGDINGNSQVNIELTAL